MNKGFDYPRDFKGIWIPKEIWLDDDLNATDKIIFAEIDSLDVDDSDGCYASNEYLSNFCKCSITKVSTSISKLIGLGYVRVIKSDGRKRWLKTCLSKFESQNGENKKSEIQEMKERNIPSKKVDKNTDNNALLSERSSESVPPQPKRQSRKKEANELFERVWKLYPKKFGKGKISDTQKLKLLEIGYDELSRAIQRCCSYNKDKDKQYWQNGSTFFNSGYIDFLDENYEDSSSPNIGMKEVQKEPLSEKEKIRLGIEKAREIFGDDYGESYWVGMDDGEIYGMLGLLGIDVDKL